MNSGTKAPGAMPVVETEPAMPKPVVVGVRGDASIPALRWAARAARARGSVLEALTAWELPEPPPHMPSDLRAVSQDVLADMRSALEAIIDRSEISTIPGLQIRTTVVAAPAKVALAKASARADLLVLAAEHHKAAYAPLSAGRRTAALAICPVVLVPSTPAESGPPRAGDRFIVGMDGSPQSLIALDWACAEAARRQLPVQVVTVGLYGEASAAIGEALARERQARPSIPLTLKTSAGDPAEILAEESVGAEALVLGQHGSGWLGRQLPSLGSVSRWFAAHPGCPVAIVPLGRELR